MEIKGRYFGENYSSISAIIELQIFAQAFQHHDLIYVLRKRLWDSDVYQQSKNWYYHLLHASLPFPSNHKRPS
jgi:hypothetical protein